MSFRLGSPGLSIEVASNIGGDGSQDPGTCLSLLTESQRTYFLANECDVNGSNCNVSVMAFDLGDSTGAGVGDGENDAWEVVAEGVTALMCHRRTGTVLGKATLTFGFKAEKK